MNNRVLILDDDKITNQVLSLVLEKANYEVASFAGSREALSHFREHPGGVVLLDLFLEEEYGIDVLPEFLRIDPDTAILVITARASMDSVIQALHGGAYDYVKKPVESEQLVNAVRRASEKYRLGSENRRLLTELSGQVRQLELIGRISTMITSTLELTPLLNLVMEQTQNLLLAEASSLMILDEDSRNLRVAVALGPEGKKIYDRTIPVGEGIAGWVAREKTPLFVCDVREDPRFFPDFDQLSGFRTKSILAAPLLVRGEVLGVIEVLNRKDGHAFQESDLKLLLSFTPHIAVAVDNARVTENLRRSHEELEVRVKQRTEELTRTLEDLEQSHQKLQQAQAQLIQSEKLAALGQLAAGVAHEINNPIAYINANLNSLGNYFDDLLKLHELHQAFLRTWQRGAGSDLHSLSRDIKALEADIEVEELTTDLKSLLDETRQGTRRVSEIVQNLKSFARADAGSAEPVDVNSRIEETLTVIHNELKYRVEVVRELEKVPPVLGQPGELNQVFLNLLVNAAQAIEKKGKIRIHTFSRDGSVGIEISDTGSGIPPENLSRIFDPFFTTKATGQGTGLGLSVAYGIIEKHGGKIEVRSTPGEGTTFVVSLPVMDRNGKCEGEDSPEMSG